MLKISGVRKVLLNLSKTSGRIGNSVSRGLKKGGLLLQRESQLVVPVDTAALKNSAFTRSEGRGFETDVTVGYTQNYAVFVHEDLSKQHKQGKIAKFLWRPAVENKEKILGIIATEAKKGI